MGMQARELSWSWWPTGIRADVSAGADTLCWGAGVSAVASSGRYAPFWLQSNTHGDVTTTGKNIAKIAHNFFLHFGKFLIKVRLQSLSGRLTT